MNSVTSSSLSQPYHIASSPASSNEVCNGGDIRDQTVFLSAAASSTSSSDAQNDSFSSSNNSSPMLAGVGGEHTMQHFAPVLDSPSALRPNQAMVARDESYSYNKCPPVGNQQYLPQSPYSTPPSPYWQVPSKPLAFYGAPPPSSGESFSMLSSQQLQQHNYGNSVASMSPLYDHLPSFTHPLIDYPQQSFNSPSGDFYPQPFPQPQKFLYDLSSYPPYNPLQMPPAKKEPTGFASGGRQKPAPQRRRTGGRRPKDEHVRLTPEETRKREQRRQRNKEAAARCRERRLRKLVQLEGEVQKLKSAQYQLQQRCEALHERKNQLESIISSHEPFCRVGGISLPQRTSSPYQPAVKIEPSHSPIATSVAPSFQTPTLPLPHISLGSAAMEDSELLDSPIVRPNTLVFGGGLPTPGLLTSDTPSRGLFHFGQEGAQMDLLGGSIGLTPTTNTAIMPVMMIYSSGVDTPTSLETPVTAMAGMK